MPIIFITIKNRHCQVMTFDTLVFFRRYNVDIFERRNGIYAQPDTGICRASNNEPITAPQRETCSRMIFMINSDMKLYEFVQDHMITHLLHLCKNELGLDQLPDIHMVDQPTVSGGTSFGQFTDDGIEIVTKDRHPMDIMRTLAHELVHWKQRQNGMKMDGSDGSETENEANSIAGIIMRKFGKQYPQYFLDTLP
jgi:hypothetical protein